MLPRRGSICGRLTQDFPLGCLQGGQAALPTGDETEGEEEEVGGGDEAMDGGEEV